MHLPLMQNGREYKTSRSGQMGSFELHEIFRSCFFSQMKCWLQPAHWKHQFALNPFAIRNIDLVQCDDLRMIKPIRNSESDYQIRCRIPVRISVPN